MPYKQFANGFGTVYFNTKFCFCTQLYHAWQTLF